MTIVEPRSGPRPDDRALPYHGVVATRVASPDFIGRARELGSLRDALERGRAGDATVALVGGDAGIGKTRLVAEAVTQARDAGSLVLEGGCVSLGSGEGLPFGPIVEALRRLPDIIEAGEAGAIADIADLRSTETSDLGRLLPELGSGPAPDAGMFDRPDWVQARIFEGMLALLRTLGEQSAVVLVVEDLHWSDSSTRDLLSFLARNARTERLAILGTYRTDDLHRRHPLRPWLAEMERLPRVVRIEVGRLARTELIDLISAILGHRPPDDLVDAIAERAEGNPFFVEELLASGIDDAADRIPPTLRDVLLTRVTALSDEAQRILGVAAVAGRTVQPALLATVAGVDESTIEGPLREALAAQILTIDQSSRGDAYRFRHALLAEAVYDDLLPNERRRLHAAYAALLDAQPIPEGAEGASLLAALAHHATAAHDQVRALHAWVRAARAAAETHAFGEARRAYERAIELWDAVPADDRPDVDAAALYFEAALCEWSVVGPSGRSISPGPRSTALTGSGTRSAGLPRTSGSPNGVASRGDGRRPRDPRVDSGVPGAGANRHPFVPGSWRRSPAPTCCVEITLGRSTPPATRSRSRRRSDRGCPRPMPATRSAPRRPWSGDAPRASPSFVRASS